MIYPQPRSVRWLVGLFVLSLAIELSAIFTKIPFPPNTVLLGLMLGFVTMLCLDALLTFSYCAPTLQRQVPTSAAIARPLAIEYTIECNHSREKRCQISDHLPNEFQRLERILEATLRTNQAAIITQTIRPTHRGHYQWSRCDVNVSSPLGFWWKRFAIHSNASLKIYPDVKAIQSLFLFSQTNAQNQSGIKRNRKRGIGHTFHQLRDYHHGDSLRQVDWKASSRHHRLISKDYQEERDQHIVLALDCGRRMRAHDDDLSHFDLTLNAVLMLAFSAFKQGDRVSMATFAGEQRQIMNLKGTNAINALLNTMYDLQPTPNASDYLTSLSTLGDKLHKRSLIVVTTTFRGESLQDLREAVLHLQKRHHVMIANLMESVVNQKLAHIIEQDSDADIYLGALSYREELDQGVAMLRRTGSTVLQATPQTLGPELIQHYQALKCAGQI